MTALWIINGLAFLYGLWPIAALSRNKDYGQEAFNARLSFAALAIVNMIALSVS